jgi:hypothetical protein
MGWFLGKSNSLCEAVKGSLEDFADAGALPAELARHAASCADCQRMVDDYRASHVLLSSLRREPAESRPWFATGVMAAIAAREAQLQGSLEKWGAIPLLASKFAWVSVFALLLSGTWLVGRQQASGAAWTPTDLAGETLVDRHPAPVDNDEVLNNLGERTE